MRANIKEVWVILECPNCNRPQTASFWVTDNNMVLDLSRLRKMECKFCEHGYELQVKEIDTRLPVT